MGRLRQRYEQALLPLGRLLSKIGLGPNTLTGLSFLSSIAGGWYYAQREITWGIVMILIMGLLDIFDGTIARATGKTTRFGAVIDQVLDRYAEAFLLMGIIIGGYVDWFWAVVCLVGMFMASFTRARAESAGGLSSCSVGIAERQEKVGSILLASLATLYWKSALFYGVVLVAILSHVTVVQRLAYTWRKTHGE